MEKVSFNYSNVIPHIEEREIEELQEKINLYHYFLNSGMGKGGEYVGWVKLPMDYDKEEFQRIKIVTEKIKNNSEILLVVGIGGSYLGSRAAIEMLNHSFYNELSKEKRNSPKVYFVGYNMSSQHFNDLISIIGNQDVSINIISKSGTTIEPALAFRFLQEYMVTRYSPEEIKERIYTTTDISEGALKSLADKEGYETFVIPNNVGGRYSVLTAVGLLPIAVAGINIDKIMEGAYDAMKDLDTPYNNPAYTYAAIRNILYTRGKTTEIIVNYEPSLSSFGQWFMQLFGESEGKDGKGIFPVSLNFTTDLHSMGQYIQEGRKDIFETIFNVEKSKEKIIIKENKDNLDGLNYLKGKTLDYINKKALEGTINTHVEGEVPNLVFNIPEISPYYFGYLIYFFEKACGMSGYLFGVNPFDQPGVESYKKNMFKLLGKSE